MRDQSLTPEQALHMQEQQEKELPFIWRKPWAGPTKFIDKLSKKAASLKRKKINVAGFSGDELSSLS